MDSIETDSWSRLARLCASPVRRRGSRLRGCTLAARGCAQQLSLYIKKICRALQGSMEVARDTQAVQ